MKSNIKFLTGGLCIGIVILALFHSSASAQISAEQDSTQVIWEINTILNPIVMPFLGSGAGFGSSRNPIGIQVKRKTSTGAFRMGLDFNNLSNLQAIGFGNRRIVEVNQDTLTYLVHDYRSNMGRMQFGFEKSRQGAIGRVYVGSDFSLVYDHTAHYAYLTKYEAGSNRYVDETKENRSFHDRYISSFGVGVKPFIGVERPLTERLGVNVEVKYDMIATVGEASFVNDDATFSDGGELFLFETFPLLEFRFYYEF